MPKGISTRGEALVNQTADGVDLNTVWQDGMFPLDESTQF